MLKTPPPVDNDSVKSEPWRNFMQNVYKELNKFIPGRLEVQPLSGFEIGTGADVGDLMWRDAGGTLHKVVDV
jgi:hypothetical protein